MEIKHFRHFLRTPPRQGALVSHSERLDGSPEEIEMPLSNWLEK